ncbi:TetR/AcrR family transcriptional regulator [Pseudonocardia sp. GCM10023141]|uniref:TetR/AcrR family transcriptional regulator n=1 Tax=Pseudonocardia sp. GCM10023141 TaxID=3252653 RepID=UPI0036177B10
MSTRVYGGRDTAARRAERRTRLLDAGLHLLGTGGLQATTVRKVCEQSQLAARYFYESFPDVDALAVAVFDDIIEELVLAGVRALAAAGPDPVARLRAGLGCAIDLVADDPHKGRVVMGLALASPALAQRRLQAGEHIARLVAEHTRNDYAGAAPTERQLTLVSRFLVGGFTETLTAWLRDPAAVPREQVLDDCTTLFRAALAAVDRLAP